MIPLGSDGQPLSLGPSTNLPRSFGCTFQVTEVVEEYTELKWSGDGCITEEKRDDVLDALRDTATRGAEYDYPAIEKV